jgi:DNA-directed RNA polymerase subunit alpha
MLNFQTLLPQEIIEETEQPIPDAKMMVVETSEDYGRISVEPLQRGFGVTLGNPLRRVLYSSLSGCAITWVKIEGVLHEYGTIPGVKEEVGELLMNIKDIRLRSAVETPGKLRLDVAGEIDVTAGDIMASSDYEIANPEQHIATLDSANSSLSIELTVERGSGYVEAAYGEGLPIGVLPVDAIFTPIRKVNYTVENVRVGHHPDFEKLTLEIWTDGTIDPMEAMRQAGTILAENFFIFAKSRESDEDGVVTSPISKWLSPEQYNVPVERLELSSRTLNCLKRASIDSVGQVLELQKSDLLAIRNFGEKSFTELFDRLRETDLLPAELDPDMNETTHDE